MVRSMTGFGRSTAELPNKKVSVEIKSLNSKQFDLNSKVPSIYRDKEMEIRNVLLQTVERGKVDFSIYVEDINNNISSQINQGAVENYYDQIRDLAKTIGLQIPENIISVILRLPETIKTESSKIDEAEWQLLFEVIDKALQQFTAFRIQEGQMLQNLFEQKIQSIAALLKEVECFEPERTERIKTKLVESLEKIDVATYDQNRFEQELIYYIERFDINEEKNRLSNHLSYFIETMSEDKAQGRKLGFIAQEIGREINTMGSKSNHVEIQKIVVRMKDELEQIKEQLSNVL
ncbi:MAG: YicC family protein [Dysgonamonadaceae bacterium]|nr:YicC family protein [Dysgonamonadaceae bacterium]